MECEKSRRLPGTVPIHQWASKVVNFSSQYDSMGWSASQAVGEPKVYPRYGDISGAWAQCVNDSEQFIELGFDAAVYISAINVYETLNTGGVTRISVRSPQKTWDIVWETDQAEHLTVSRIFSPQITSPAYRTKAVRLDIDCSVSESWVEIDAVQLVGKRFNTEFSQPQSTLSEDLAKLVNDKESSDVVFRVQGRDIYAHRAILAVRSQKLKKMVAPAKMDGVIAVDGIDYQTFLGALHFVYSNSIPADYSPGSLVKVWRAADQLQIDGLQAYCVTKIDEKVDTDNVVDIFTNASNNDPVSQDIKEVCLEFLASNLAVVSLTPQFKELPQALLLEIVQLCTARMTIDN